MSRPAPERGDHLAIAEEHLEAAQASVGGALSTETAQVSALTSIAASLIAIADELSGINARTMREERRALAALADVNRFEAWLADTPESDQVCEDCGCGPSQACEGGCYWIAPRRCSSCDRRGRPLERAPLIEVPR